MLHGESVEVGQGLTKAFLAEARDAAEVQIMQGTNPLAMTAGLVTWRSADGVGAPGAAVFAPWSSSTRRRRRSVGCRISSSTARCCAASRWTFRVLAGRISTALDGEALAARRRRGLRQAARIGQRRRLGRRTADLRIDDVCLVGSFDSARSVPRAPAAICRRFPISRQEPSRRPAGAGAPRRPAKTPIVEGEFDAQKARSRPDKTQALAVKASLGGTSFVVEGPPGTGKTQTIAAMVEALAKRVSAFWSRRRCRERSKSLGVGSPGRFLFGISSLRAGQIDVGRSRRQKIDPRIAKPDVVIGTPMALTKRLAGRRQVSTC